MADVSGFADHAGSAQIGHDHSAPRFSVFSVVCHRLIPVLSVEKWGACQRNSPMSALHHCPFAGREVAALRHVTGGIDAGNRGAHVIVDDNALINLGSSAFEK
jgi:hypothetical protein